MNATTRKYFVAWLKYRNAPDALAEIAKVRRVYWLSLLVCGLAAGVASVLVPEDIKFIIGILGGASIASCVILEQRVRDFQKLWPELREVVDWERIEKRASENV